MNSNNKVYDIVVIGGGAVGSGIALDATLRGHKVLLLEKNDFASGASSKSSKLVHGGIRYLEKAIKQFDRAQYNLVSEGLCERSIFLKNAPFFSKKGKTMTTEEKILKVKENIKAMKEIEKLEKEVIKLQKNIDTKKAKIEELAKSL